MAIVLLVWFRSFGSRARVPARSSKPVAGALVPPVCTFLPRCVDGPNLSRVMANPGMVKVPAAGPRWVGTNSRSTSYDVFPHGGLATRYSTEDVPEGTRYQKFTGDLEKYVLAVGLLKLFLGAAAWQAAADFFDDFAFPGTASGPSGIFTARYQSSPGLYLFRALFVGLADGTCCTLGGYFAWLIEQRGARKLPDRQARRDLWHLWLSASVVGFGWQYCCDLSCAEYLWWHNQGWLAPNDPTYSGLEVLWNFAVYGVLQSILFRIMSRTLLNASWAEAWIDLQVGLAGFGFYLAGEVSLDSHVLRSINAGAWTSLLAILLILPVLLWRHALFPLYRKVRPAPSQRDVMRAALTTPEPSREILHTQSVP